MRTVLSRPEYQAWQEWKWNQALGTYRGAPIQVLTPLTGAWPVNRACAPTTTPPELTITFGQNERMFDIENDMDISS